MLNAGTYRTSDRTGSAADRQEALELAQVHHPDVILMDLSMPVLDGWEATARIKAHDGLRHIPVLAVTGHVTPHELHRAFEAGCVDYITKPIDFERLIGKVTSFLNNGRDGKG